MQVFTRCVNSAVEADAVISFWFVVHAKTQQPKTQQATKPQPKNKKQQRKQTHKQNKTRTKESQWNDIFKAVLKRSDQATYVPRPEQVIFEATAQSQH